MGKNVTLRMDEAVLRKCRHAAVEEDKSLSQWIADQLTRVVAEGDEYSRARERALQRLKRGFDLGGRPLSREEIYEK